MTYKKVPIFFPYPELKKQVESAELKNQRLKEVFQTKIQEFRKVCYTLTGYQIDITTENQYRLSSIYAEHQGDCLLFKVGLCTPGCSCFLGLVVFSVPGCICFVLGIRLENRCPLLRGRVFLVREVKILSSVKKQEV